MGIHSLWLSLPNAKNKIILILADCSVLDFHLPVTNIGLLSLFHSVTYASLNNAHNRTEFPKLSRLARNGEGEGRDDLVCVCVNACTCACTRMNTHCSGEWMLAVMWVLTRETANTCNARTMLTRMGLWMPAMLMEMRKWGCEHMWHSQRRLCEWDHECPQCLWWCASVAMHAHAYAQAGQWLTRPSGQ